MAQAWELSLSPTMKLVLLALCDWANDVGVCFPSVATIAHKSSISRRHCQRILAVLIADGLVEIVGNASGGLASRRYRVNPTGTRSGDGSGGDNLSPVAPVTPPPTTLVTTRDDADVTRTTTIRQCDPPLHAHSPPAIDWAFLPQLSKQERVVVVDMLNGVAKSQHQSIVDELAGALRAKAIKAQWPAWLHGLARRALTGAFVPNHALAIQRDRQRAAREAEEAEKRRVEDERRSDPVARERGLAAMKAAVAALKSPTNEEDSSS